VRRQSQLPRCPISVAGASVEPVSAIRDFFFIVSDLGAATHVLRTVSRCFAALRQLRQLRRFVTNDCFCSLVVSLVHSRLDYSNFILVGVPAYLQRHLQAVLNAAARLVFRLRRYTTTSPTPSRIAILHWLRLPERVNFKLALMAYRVLHGMAPEYLNQLDELVLVSTKSPPNAVVVYTSAARSAIPSDNHRSSLVSGCSIHRLDSLPVYPQSSLLLFTFRQRLKTYLFQQSFPRHPHLTFLHYATVDFVMAIICH